MAQFEIYSLSSSQRPRSGPPALACVRRVCGGLADRLGSRAPASSELAIQGKKHIPSLPETPPALTGRQFLKNGGISRLGVVGSSRREPTPQATASCRSAANLTTRPANRATAQARHAEQASSCSGKGRKEPTWTLLVISMIHDPLRCGIAACPEPNSELQ